MCVYRISIQNQVGQSPRKWDRTGTIIEVRQFDQYAVKVDGSGRVTLRNRKFLRRFTPVMPQNSSFQTPSHSTPLIPQPFTIPSPSQTRPVPPIHPSHLGLDKTAAPVSMKKDEHQTSSALPMKGVIPPHIQRSDIQPTTPVVQKSTKPAQSTPSVSDGSPSGVTTYNTPPRSGQKAQSSTQEPRRSQRIKKVPGHLSDYELK